MQSVGLVGMVWEKYCSEIVGKFRLVQREIVVDLDDPLHEGPRVTTRGGAHYTPGFEFCSIIISSYSFNQLRRFSTAYGRS